MNARPVPLCTSPIADVASLECEVSYAAAITAGNDLVKALKLGLNDACVDQQGIHLHMISLSTTARIGHDIDTCGSGVDCDQAQRSGLYPAIAQMIQADYATTSVVEGCKVQDYLNLPGVEQAFFNIVPMIAEQPKAIIGTTRFEEINGTRTLEVPTALVNPYYLRDVEVGTAPRRIKDDFDYALLRKYTSNCGTAAGATRDEAILQAMLAAQEHRAAGRFAVQGIALRQPQFLRRVDEATLPAQIRALWEITEKRHGQRVHLFDIRGQGMTPTYLACAEGPTPIEYSVTTGAGFTAEHAATRALRTLLQQHEFNAWMRSRNGSDPAAAMQRRQQDFLSVHDGQYRQFAVQNLQAIISSGDFETVAFGKAGDPLADTLSGRIEQLRENFRHAGLTPWVSQYKVPGAANALACVQVLLAPFDADFLLLHGVPVGISVASLEAAANQE